MKHRSFLLFVLTFPLLVALACQVTGTAQDEPQTPAEEEQALFEDDFSDPNSGWGTLRESGTIADYESGGFRILVNDINADVTATPGRLFSDMRIEVTATKTGGPDDNDFGVICRYQDENNYYFLIISSDGFYGIGALVEGEARLLGMDAMEYSNEINQGSGASNQIRGDCVAERLTLYVNGTILAEGTDNRFQSGDVGLIAGTFDEPGTDILFDNFVIRRP